MIYLLSNIHEWTLTLLTIEVLRRYLPYILCGQPVCYALIQDGGKNGESAYIVCLFLRNSARLMLKMASPRLACDL